VAEKTNSRNVQRGRVCAAETKSQAERTTARLYSGTGTGRMEVQQDRASAKKKFRFVIRLVLVRHTKTQKNARVARNREKGGRTRCVKTSSALGARTQAMSSGSDERRAVKEEPLLL